MKRRALFSRSTRSVYSGLGSASRIGIVWSKPILRCRLEEMSKICLSVGLKLAPM
ncbi:hypothetical protein MHBO_000055 [Bonamia ostreae]|uniref:Uncharacterized protein n=1 Tax=Bonamia ostreae TaxID=126728 RepID=A0ABV2AEA3_9EUKA